MTKPKSKKKGKIIKPPIPLQNDIGSYMRLSWQSMNESSSTARKLSEKRRESLETKQVSSAFSSTDGEPIV
ncbi:unnamed protein product [Brassica oleracea var. botrytis]|uniref:(rape) hypothetical protein n=1 Tax=Brassica napus TaxID=3708 RepID=A0A816IVX9_BRANA|nr:unnamed protein product [Brassica napus]